MTINKPRITENIAGTVAMKLSEKPDKLIGVTSLFFVNLTKRNIPEKRKINGEKLKIIVGDLTKDIIKTFKKKLPIISFCFKKIISSMNTEKIINDEKIVKKIIKEKQNSFTKYLIKIFGVYLFILNFQILKIFWKVYFVKQK